MDVRQITVTGGADTWLPEATISEISADYDLWELWKNGPGNFLGSVKVHDATVRVDLGKLPAAGPKSTESTKAAEPAQLPWPKSLDLKNVNVILTLADGAEWRIMGLTLQAGEGQPGRFSLAELRQTPGLIAAGPLFADVDLQHGLLALRNLILPDVGNVSELTADLRKFSDGEAAVSLKGASGGAQVDLAASAEQLHKPRPVFSAALQLTGVNHTEVQRWGLPDGLEFSGGSLALKARGTAASPRDLDVSAELHAASFEMAGWRLDEITAAASSAGGAFSLTQLSVRRAANALSLTGTAGLPAAWDEWNALRWNGKLDASIADAAALSPVLQPASGRAEIHLTANGTGDGLPGAAGTIAGENIGWEGYRVARLNGNLDTQGERSSLREWKLEFGSGNSLTLNADVSRANPFATVLDWTTTIADPAALMASLALEPLPENPIGRLDSAGRLAFSISDVAAGRFSGVEGEVRLDGADLACGNASVPDLQATVVARDGVASLTALTARVDAENVLTATAQVDLESPLKFQASLRPKLAKSDALNRLLKQFGSTQLESGTATATWDGKGTLQPFDANGAFALQINKARTPAMPDPLSASTSGSHTMKSVDLAKLSATVGRYRLGLGGRVTPEAARLDGIELRLEETLLVSGHAGVPFSLFSPEISSPGPLDVELSVKNLALGEGMAALGQRDALRGVLNARVALAGPVSQAAGNAEIDLRDISLPAAGGSLPPGSFHLDATVKNGRFAGAARAIQPPLQPLDVAAELPLDVAKLIRDPSQLPATPFTASAKLPASDLAILARLAPGAVRDINGTGSVSISASGTLRQPDVLGRIEARADSIDLAGIDAPSIRDGRLVIRFDGNHADIDEMSAILAGGRVKVAGIVDLRNLARPVLDLQAKATEALVLRDPETSLRANADLTLKGPVMNPTLAGTVEAVRGRIFKEVEFLPLSLPSDLPPLPPSVDPSAALSLPAPLNRWNFDVAVKTKDPIRLMGNILRGGVLLDVSLRGVGASPQIAGTATFDEAALYLPYSRMKITRGIATIDPQSPMDPRLDIRGESHVGDYDVTLYLYGTAADPKTRFLSVPPLPEPDIAALLATGTTLGGNAQTVAAETAGRAAFLILSQAYRKLFKVKSPPSEEPPKLHLTVEPGSIKEPGGVVGATYDLTKRIQVEGRVSSSGSVRGLLRYLVRFGKAAAPPTAP